MTPEITDLVNARLKRAQQSKEFKDTEQRAFGTRKEMAALKMIRLSDLSALEENPDLAAELVKKDKVWPKYSLDQDIDRGASGGTAYLKYRMRNVYPVASENSALARMIYVGLADMLYRDFVEATTLNQIAKSLTKYKSDFLIYRVAEIIADDEQRQRLGEEQNHFISTKDGQERYGLDRDVLLENSELYRVLNPFGKRKMTVRGYERSGDKLFDFVFDNVGIIWLIENDIFSKRSVTAWHKFVHSAIDEATVYEPLSKEDSDKKLFWFRKAVTDFEDQSKKMTEYWLRFKDTDRSRHQELYEIIDQVEKNIERVTGIGFWIRSENKHIYLTQLKEKYRTNIAVLTDWLSQAEAYLKERLEKNKKELTNQEKLFLPHGNVYTWHPSHKPESEEQKDKEKDEETGTALEINRGVPLQYIKRIGGYVVKDEDVQVDTIVNRYGFKSVTLGNYVKDNEAREHIRHFLGAISDLGEVLNMDIRHLNSIHQRSPLQRLSMWFGAGGRGGKASAFYMSSSCVINITKTKGDGTVAHEYAHYLDNAVYTALQDGGYDIQNANRSMMSTVRQSGEKRSKTGIYNSEGARYYIANRPQPFIDLMNFIYGLQIPSWLRLSQAELLERRQKEGKAVGKLRVMRGSAKSWRLPEPSPGQNIEEYLKQVEVRFGSMTRLSDLSGKNMDVLTWIVNKFNLPYYDFSTTSMGSNFFMHSQAMTSKYWSTAWELFARGFECYVYDWLAKNGRVNNYLVSGANFDHPARVYPYGTEREILYYLYDNVVKYIKSALNIPDFQPVHGERQDDYASLEQGQQQQIGVSISTSEQGVTERVSVSYKLEKLMQILEPELAQPNQLSPEEMLQELRQVYETAVYVPNLQAAAALGIKPEAYESGHHYFVKNNHTHNVLTESELVDAYQKYAAEMTLPVMTEDVAKLTTFIEKLNTGSTANGYDIAIEYVTFEQAVKEKGFKARHWPKQLGVVVFSYEYGGERRTEFVKGTVNATRDHYYEVREKIELWRRRQQQS